MPWQPSQSQVHVDRILTNISTAYTQAATNFIASQVFPVVPVDKRTDVYFTFTKADFQRDEAKQRADGAESAGSGYGISTSSYSCDVFALHKDIGDQTRANSDAPLSPDADATRFLTQRMLIRQEVQFMADYFVTGVWGTSATPSNLWDVYTTSDPISDMETAKRTILLSTGYLPNTLVLGYDAFRYLRHHPDIIARIDGASTATTPALASQSTLAAIFSVDRVLVPMAVRDTAVEGEAASRAFIAGANDALLCYSNPSPGLLAPSAGYIFNWQGVSQGLGANIGVSSFRMEHLKATRVEAEVAFDCALVGTDLGYMFIDVNS